MTDSQKLDLLLEMTRGMDRNISELGVKVIDLDERMAKVEIGIADVKSDIVMLKTDVDALKSDMTVLTARVDAMEAKLDRLETEVKHIKLILENEVRPNIRTIAEGHLDLSGQLNEAMKSAARAEDLNVGVVALETEVKILQAKVS